LALRASAARELANGRGEWEAEVAYSSTKDGSAGVMCGNLATCFGAAQS
jgi:diaminopimelate epimerase